nr:SLATT domain-containing protein [uncultured Rhodopila sp.]
MARKAEAPSDSWDPITWSQLPPQDGLKSLFEHVMGESRKAQGWYERHKKSPQSWSRLFRAMAIVFGATGGLAPIVSGIRLNSITPEIASLISQLGYLLIGIAAGLLAFDRYFGLSSAWLRYVTALTTLQRLEAAFLMRWSDLLLTQPSPSSKEDMQPFLESAREFWLAVIDLVGKETDTWSREFQAAVTDLERLVKAGREKTKDQERAARNAMAASRSRSGTKNDSGAR